MCGIFGWSVSDSKRLGVAKRIALSSILQAMNDSRGGDSWGYYAVERDGGYTLNRGIGLMVETPARDIARHKIVMAHTRKATTGAISIENCHPFDVNNIIGAHNGMIANHTEMNKEHKRTCEVDSMHIFHHISEQKPLNELEGYGAIEYIQKKNPDRVFLSKLRMGQLSVVGIGSGPEDVGGVVWSSDSAHLEKALANAGVVSFEYKIEEGALYFVENGKLFQTQKKLEFKTRTFTQHDYSSTGYTHTAYGRGGRGFQEDYTDDADFMEYLGNKYGATSTKPASKGEITVLKGSDIVSEETQSGSSKSNLPVLVRGETPLLPFHSLTAEQDAIALESLAKEHANRNQVEEEDGTVIDFVDGNTPDTIKEQILADAMRSQVTNKK